ncbi:hypothetical protein PM082_003087 [Marasmius tenuissimus]|nr:hypothetical protein PM082_003087 [Marasmius tenuissimus]
MQQHSFHYIHHPDHLISLPPTTHVGLDIEWKPNFLKNAPENPVALVQLATATSVYLFHLSRLTSFPPSLRSLLQNPKILKTGVGIQNDVNKLWIDCAVSVTNVVDLGMLAKAIDSQLFRERLGRYQELLYYPQHVHDESDSAHPYDPYQQRLFRGPFKENVGLARMAKVFQDKDMDKAKSVTRSNWELPLTQRQIHYAAADAITSHSLYYNIIDQLVHLPLHLYPKRKYYTFDAIRGSFYESMYPDEREPQRAIVATEVTEQEEELYLQGIPQGGLRQWFINNPEYDPAPRPRIEKKDGEKKEGKKDKDNTHRGRGRGRGHRGESSRGRGRGRPPMLP